MKAIQIADGIHWIGASVSTNDLFEGIWPIPDGVTINAYVVQGDKIAIIDPVRDWAGAATYLIDELFSIGIQPKDVDYIILNHLEPDHTGDLRTLREMAPNAEIITSQKGVPLVEAFYGITGKVRAVKSGDTLNLGKGKMLSFYEIPNVHWPETMATFESSTGTLFPCDAFGSYGAFKGSIFDDETCEEDHKFYERESLRYYANIVGPFSNFVSKAIGALGPLDIKIIAPSHGLIWRGDPTRIVRRYQTYANYMKDYAEPKITVIWGSMYGNTELMLRSILQGVACEGVTVNLHRIPETDPSYVLASAWESAGLIFGMPTYEYKMYPPMRNIIDLFVTKHVWHKKVLRFGSFGWSGGAQKDFESRIDKMKWDLMEPLEFQGAPTDADLEKGYEMGRKFAQSIKLIPNKLD